MMKKLLAVDDDPVVLRYIDLIFSEMGFEVVTAEDGLAALDALKNYTPDVIIVDIVMPNIDGKKLCKILRGMKKLEDTYLIVLSATAVEEDMKASDFGADTFIAKGPYEETTRHILAAIEQPEIFSSRCKSGEVIGIENVYPRRITKELLYVKKHFEVIIDKISEGILELGPGGRILYVNPAALSIIAWPEEKLLGQNLAELFPAPHRGEIVKLLEALDKGTRAVGEEPLMMLNERLLTMDILPVEEDGSRAVVILKDVTDRKMHDKTLQASEEKYRTILESMEDGYYETDIAGNFTFFNESLCEILGHSRDEIIGMDYRQYTDGETAKRVYQTFNKVYTTGNPDKGLNWPIIGKDGTKRSVEASVSLRKNAEGEPIGFRGAVRDISEKQRLEAQLQQANRVEAIGTLAGGVAHDLNNILGGLVSYPELLLVQIPEDSPLRKPMLTIQKSGEKAAAVVQDLLTLARRGVVVTEVVNPNHTISEYLGSPEHEKLQSYHPGVHIERHLEKDVLNILGSPTHLSKTIMNLVSNAAEAMPNGGRLAISTENRYIDRPISGYDNVKEGDYVVLTVSDTGTGISTEDMEMIFEPFYTKKKMGRSGTGLGMAVVWGTVKDHNGYIHVQSTEGKGTTFTLYFPVTRKSLEERSETSLENYMGKGEAILVVDDVEEQRQIASGMLKELGYSVVSVSSGEEAVEYLKTNKADLLLLDMIMDPGMDGLDTYKKILEIHPEQKAIIASGFSETGRVKTVQSLGAGAYIRKPLLLDKIGIAVKDELEK